MNKIYYVLLFLIASVSGFAQIKEFNIPAKNKGYLDVVVSQNDTVVVHEPDAHILSSKTYDAYQKFKDNYLNCLNERESDIISIERKLKEINLSIDEIIRQIEKQESLSAEVLQQSEKELNSLLIDLNNDIANLNGIRSSIDEAEQKLTTIEKKLKKERAKLFWRKIGDIVVAGGLGILIGATFFGG